MVLKLIPVIPPERMTLSESTEQNQTLYCLQAFTNILQSAPTYTEKIFAVI